MYSNIFTCWLFDGLAWTKFETTCCGLCVLDEFEFEASSIRSLASGLSMFLCEGLLFFLRMNVTISIRKTKTKAPKHATRMYNVSLDKVWGLVAWPETKCTWLITEYLELPLAPSVFVDQKSVKIAKNSNDFN